MNNQKILQQIQILMNQFNAKNFELVISKGKVLLKKNPQYAILYNLIGSAYQNIGEYEKAKNLFKNGLQYDANNIALMNNLAMANKNLLLYREAEEIYLKILNINDKYLNAYINFGNLKRDLNQFKEAIKLYEKANGIDEKNPIVCYSLALAHQGIGNFKEAIFYSKRALEIDPNFTRADHLISQSTKYNEKDEHYLSLKKKIKNVKPKSYEEIDLYFSIAKAEEDLGNFQKSSEFLIKGNKLRKDITKYDVSKEIKLLENIKTEFSKIENEKLKSETNDNIIFILGMPRSGTSLVEQIITSHSQVFGGGELPILSNIIKNYFINEKEFIDAKKIKETQKNLQIEKFRFEYNNFIESFKFSEKYITDKAPLNFRWIGFIRSFFPTAKIIHCSRDSKNNCLSMFKNLFEGGLNFTYDQEDLVKYFKNYEILMNFWKKKYGKYILDVKYEKLILNSDEQIKAIINFCELPWEENCLSFHKNKTPIKTMSTAQARNPIYKSSVNAFDRFKDYFEILDKKL